MQQCVVTYRLCCLFCQLEAFSDRKIVTNQKTSQRSHDSTPDILHSGHVHNIDVQNYRGTLIVNSGAWQAQTKYQEMMGIVPSPGIAIVVNLANLHPFQMNFNQPNPT